AFEDHPRRDPFLDNKPADSKPAVWWNVKYKNKWLSDGSVISGNPIFTNIIWNEVGRGADLRVLENWLSQNQKVIDELTAMVFASEAPIITDFFPAEKIDIGRAKLGEQLFKQNCARCHGLYEKAWSQPGSEQLPLRDQLKTVKVIPRRNTPVEDVGTDPYRRLGMKSLEQLNHLSISKKNNIVIQAQPGYVPPPLVGIWGRWPYMHNNSIPSLCALLTRSELRPKYYYAGKALQQDRDFDFACNGYPLGNRTPVAWREWAFLYDTRKVGMSNVGHDEGIFLDNGKEILSVEEKKDLIFYLQTL
ncbi:MAG TPA: cytochrome c, partial [Bdellovibrio sp.]|nr:cytochrome c [Bdellovibrio sp.]